MGLQPKSIVVSLARTHFFTIDLSKSGVSNKQHGVLIDDDKISALPRKYVDSVEMVVTKAIGGIGKKPTAEAEESMQSDRVEVGTKALGTGTFGVVYKCKVDGKPGYCVKFARGSRSEDVELSVEGRIGSRLGRTLRCVPVLWLIEVNRKPPHPHAPVVVLTHNRRGPLGLRHPIRALAPVSQPKPVPRVGLVMPMFECGFIEFIELQTAQNTATPQKTWDKAFVMWGCDEVVRGMLELHALGIQHGDVKWSNIGVDLNLQDSKTPKTFQFQKYLVRLCDFGMSGRGISVGTFPFRASDWSRCPEDILCVDKSTDERIAERRSDWFQVLMSALDLVYLVCTPKAHLSSTCGGAKKIKRPTQELYKIGDDWVAAGRPGGWMACVLAGRITQTPATVADFYNESAALKAFDLRLTTNFKTCV